MGIKSLEITGKIVKEGPDFPYTEDIDLSIRIREDIAEEDTSYPIGACVEFKRNDITDEALLVTVADLRAILQMNEGVIQ